MLNLNLILKKAILCYDSLLSISSTLLIVICLIVSSGKQEMMTATELPGRPLLTWASTPS